MSPMRVNSRRRSSFRRGTERPAGSRVRSGPRRSSPVRTRASASSTGKRTVTRLSSSPGCGCRQLDLLCEEGIGAQAEVGAGGVERREVPPGRRSSADLFEELALSGLEGAFAFLDRTGGYLERPVAHRVAVLAHQHQLLGARHGDHEDGPRDREVGIGARPSVSATQLVAQDGTPGRRSEELAGHQARRRLVADDAPFGELA